MLLWLQTRLHAGPSSTITTAITLLWYCKQEQEAGRVVVSMNPDGTNHKKIL
jgi:hypothetical protein